MLVGQQLGPFLIDKELGAGAMGAVYRGKYVKTGQMVAIKVMAPGLGSTSASATSRFEREANILKQLKHPNIVRLFGVGKHHGTRYYAMEYIQGESLDKVMARRDRMSWEEVVDLGTQLCSALQHAHEAGIVHRDLKPSNLMILADGTLKLTDFGIAKDLDVTQLTGANCTVGTAAYMSPEQCRGDPNITSKSDLYSLGVVFYELITGRKPFLADNAMEMFMSHVNETPPRPSQFALDIPIWLDNLILQLLEKKPEHRPVDAAMVARVLTTIQEKVEAQQSAGVDAARARIADRKGPAGEKASDEDRQAARSLLGKKGRKKKKKPLHEQVWLRAVGLTMILAMVVTGIILLLQPPSADSLYQQAEKLIKAEKFDEAREGPIRQYLVRYGDLDTAQTKQIRQWAEDQDAARYEKLIDRHMRYEKEKKGLPVEAQTKGEELAFKAATAELEGDRVEAVKLWKEVFELEGDRNIGIVARRHLAGLENLDREFERLDTLRREVRNFRTEPELDEYNTLALQAYRQEKLGDRAGAKRTYDRLRETATKEPVNRLWQMLAAVKSKELQDGLTAKPQTEKARVEQLQTVMADLKTNTMMSLLDKRMVAHEIALIYDKDEDMANVVKLARDLVATIDANLGKPPSR